MFVTERVDFGRPLPALRSVAEPVASTRWQIYFTVLSFQFSVGIMRPLSPLLRNLAYATSGFSFCRPTTPYPYQFSLKTCFVQKLSKFINNELAVLLLFTNTTSQMTSLTASWLLVILNHWKNFEWLSCTGFHTVFERAEIARCQHWNADNFKIL